jgi:hypothetical protein
MKIVTTENPCERLRREAEEAACEWIMWSKRDVPSPSFTPVEENKEPAPPAREETEGLYETREKEAKARWLKALDALVDCVTVNDL